MEARNQTTSFVRLVHALIRLFSSLRIIFVSVKGKAKTKRACPRLCNRPHKEDDLNDNYISRDREGGMAGFAARIHMEK